MRARRIAGLLFALAASGAALEAGAQPALRPGIAEAQPAARGTVDVDQSNGYARILFTFDAPTPVAASIADGVLTIRLGRPVTTTIDAITEKLAPYVSGGRRDRDELTYRFALTRPAALHTTRQGNLAAVDLVPDSFRGVPPELPPPPPPRPASLPNVADLPPILVRVNEFSNYTRLVFEWPAPVVYTVFPGRGRVSIRFETMARPDFSMLETRSPAWVRNAGWRLDGRATVVDFDTDPESNVRHARDGARINIDVLAPRTDAGAIAAAPPPASAASPIANPQRQAATPPPAGSDAAAVTAGASPNATMAAAPAATQITTALAAPRAEPVRGGVVLRFPAARGQAAAIFTRGETLWIVLDGHPQIDAATLLAPVTGSIERAESLRGPGAEILKLTFRASLLPSVNDDGSALNVTLTSAAVTPPDAISFTRQGTDGQPVLAASLPGATRAILLTDPDAEDQFYAIPARPGRGVLTPKRFVELEAIPSTAGLAILPQTDDLVVQVQNGTVTFSRPGGLLLASASGTEVEPAVQPQESRFGPAFVDFQLWSATGIADVYDTQRMLRAAVSRVAESEANRARLTLARFLLAQELAPEALGEIQVMQAADPRLASDPALQAMKGVAQYMMGRYADARGTLSASVLSTDPHAAMWRGMAETKLGDFANARRDLLMSQTALSAYPEKWQTRARLARAETGLAQGDLANANDALDQLSSELPPRDMVEARLYAAQLLAAQGYVNEAIARMRAVERTDYAPIAAKATYARVETELNAKKITVPDAIQALDQLRYRWRGDDLELNTLRKLGNLHFAESRWREGLDVLRTASLNFPNTEIGRSAQDDMRRAFNDLFIGDKSDGMRPVDSLALFYDFIELTPIGREGDEMIRRLSDRLVSIDLLGPAAQLLEHQVKERLQGVARSSVATKLAMIYLLDNKPQDALAALATTRESRLPDDLTQQRRLLEARALAGLKRYDAAVDLVADDDTLDAKRLRADVYWESANWPQAGAKSEDVLGDRWNASGALSPEERAHVMRAAVAYSLAGDQAKLGALREHYTEKMSASPDAKSFAVVTEPIARQGVEFRQLASEIATLDTLQAFMAEFRRQNAATQTASN